jgi:hypothetical protein
MRPVVCQLGVDLELLEGLIGCRQLREEGFLGELLLPSGFASVLDPTREHIDEGEGHETDAPDAACERPECRAHEERD